MVSFDALFQEEEKPPGPIVEDEGESPADADCHDFSMAYFESVPYALLPTMQSTKADDHIYWFRITGSHDCSAPLQITVYFRMTTTSVFAPSEEREAGVFTVRRGEVIDRTLYPPFSFAAEDVNEPVQVRWEIRRVPDDRHLDGDQVQQDVWSKNYFPWRLKDSGGRPVPERFLLASLAAWTLPASANVVERAATLAAQVPAELPPLEFANRLMQKLHAELFAGAAIRVTPSAAVFPPPVRDRRKLQTPRQMLESGNVDALEASLLMAALVKSALTRRGIRLVLVVLPPAEGSQSILLCWHSGGLEWQAVDTTRLDQEFAANLAGATESVGELLRRRPELPSALNDEGVYWVAQGSPLALLFSRAEEKYGIARLP